jgi:hypothetical protein
VVANGCHPTRHTLDAIRAAGFDVSGVEQGELPGVPPAWPRRHLRADDRPRFLRWRQANRYETRRSAVPSA